MSVKSQEANMRKLADLLSQDLSYIYGKKESGPNGAKRTFLHVGRTFLRALAKDLGLLDYKVTSHTEGIAVSGSCTLMGIWEEGGIYICLSQFMGSKERAMLYRNMSVVMEKSSDSSVEEMRWHGADYLIVSNMGVVNCEWEKDGYSYSVSGNISADELKSVVKSFK